MKTAFACSLFCLVAAFSFAQPVRPPIQVYVWTARPDVIVPDQRGREDSVNDLIKVLDGNRYRRTLAIAASREASEIQVEVLKRGAVNTRGKYQPLDSLGKKSQSASNALTLFVTLRLRDYRLDLSCSAGEDNMLWRRTAQVCADKILDWTRTHLAQVRPTK